MFDKLEEIEAKNEDMGKWRKSFDVEQKNSFKEQEKKLSKKIDTKLTDLTVVVETKLQMHQDNLLEIIKIQDTYMKEIFNVIFNNMANIQNNTKKNQTEIRFLQGYMHNKHKQKKHGANENNLDNEIDNPDALCGNRDALTSNEDGQGGS
eukprot:15345322-Ditylum_brightwellii.AAC.1